MWRKGGRPTKKGRCGGSCHSLALSSTLLWAFWVITIIANIFPQTTTTLFVAGASSSSSSYQVGQVPETPVALTKQTFPLALQDATNPIWLFKFYAPWCGHCKKLAPVLEQVASQVAEAATPLAIGTIDCTNEKSLCNEFQVRGYPTLKYYIRPKTTTTTSRDDSSSSSQQQQHFQDYTGGRQVADFLRLARDLNRPVVQVVANLPQALSSSSSSSEVDGSDDSGSPPVVFLLFDPKIQMYADPLWKVVRSDDNNDTSSTTPTSTSITSLLSQASPLSQALVQVAEQYRTKAQFQVLVPPPSSQSSTTDDDNDDDDTTSWPETDQSTLRYLSSFLGTSSSSSSSEEGEVQPRRSGPQSPFFCRVERNYPVRCLTIQMDEEAEDPAHNPSAIDAAYLGQFVDNTQFPTLTPIGPRTFTQLTKHESLKHKPLVIAIVKIMATTTKESSSASNNKDSPQQQVLATVQQIVQDLAQHHRALSQQYQFGWMDGIRYSRFLQQQFGIQQQQLETLQEEEHFPQFLVLDAPNDLFWYNAPQLDTTDATTNDDGTGTATSSSTTTPTVISTTEQALLFLQHVQDGTLPAQSTKDVQSKNNQGNQLTQLWNRIVKWILNHQPWSIIVVTIVVLLLALAFTALLSPPPPEDIDHHRPSQHQKQRPQGQSTAPEPKKDK